MSHGFHPSLANSQTELSRLSNTWIQLIVAHVRSLPDATPICRFSEDIDVTYDIRAFAPDLVTGTGAEALPPTRSQEQRWSRATRSVGHDGRTHILGKGDRDARVLPPATPAGRPAVRHWHDVVRLDETGYAGKAFADRSLVLSVARHKAAFFREKDAGARWIDYSAAVSGGMQLVPEGFARDALQEDYERMVSGGMLADAEPFDLLIDGCADLEARANDV